MIKLEAVKDNTIYLSGEEEITPGFVIQDFIVGEKTPESRLFIKNSNIEGIYYYGSEQLQDGFLGHEKGYIWSSRASVMNKVFGTALCECAFKARGSHFYRTVAIDLVRYENLLNENGYTVEWDNPVETEHDISYNIISFRRKFVNK